MPEVTPKPKTGTLKVKVTDTHDWIRLAITDNYSTRGDHTIKLSMTLSRYKDSISAQNLGHGTQVAILNKLTAMRNACKEGRTIGDLMRELEAKANASKDIYEFIGGL
jgi:hypothetical protein